MRISTTMSMREFHSTALNRDFSLVYFTDSIVLAPGEHMQSAIKASPHPPAQVSASAQPISSGKPIRPAKNGKTIADIFSQRQRLQGKQVRVRGGVVKYVGNVFGKSWIHIRDTSSDKTLLVITSDNTKRDVILVKGTNRGIG